eukprot:7978321-Pyramimonas_sp.AAC.1
MRAYIQPTETHHYRIVLAKLMDVPLSKTGRHLLPCPLHHEAEVHQHLVAEIAPISLPVRIRCAARRSSRGWHLRWGRPERGPQQGRAEERIGLGRRCR